MTQTTELVAGPAEGQSLFAWARQALSASRARAFENALIAIDDSRFSAEWYEASRVAMAIERDARIARAGEIEAIRTVAREKVSVLEAQIAVLRDEQIAIRKASDVAENAIYSEINKTPALVEAHEVTTTLWHRDNDAVAPQRQALVAKYITAQAKASA
jgi:hypothetical protein